MTFLGYWCSLFLNTSFLTVLQLCTNNSDAPGLRSSCQPHSPPPYPSILPHVPISSFSCVTHWVFKLHSWDIPTHLLRDKEILSPFTKGLDISMKYPSFCPYTVCWLRQPNRQQPGTAHSCGTNAIAVVDRSRHTLALSPGRGSVYLFSLPLVSIPQSHTSYPW